MLTKNNLLLVLPVLLPGRADLLLARRHLDPLRALGRARGVLKWHARVSCLYQYQFKSLWEKYDESGEEEEKK